MTDNERAVVQALEDARRTWSTDPTAMPKPLVDLLLSRNQSGALPPIQSLLPSSGARLCELSSFNHQRLPSSGARLC